MQESKKNFIVGLISIGLLLIQPLLCIAEPEVSFVITGDGCRPDALSDAYSRYPALTLLISTGDNNPSGNYKGWDGFNEHVQNVFDKSFAWFPTLGNHNVDSPADMEYILSNLIAQLPTQILGISNFSKEVLPYNNIDIIAFDVFRRSNEDKRLEVITTLINAGLGFTDNSNSPLDAHFFTWTNPDMSLFDFSALLNDIDFSACLLGHYSLDTEEEVKNIIKIIYMANKVSPYSFDYGDAHFIVLNIYYDYLIKNGHICPRQMAWLENDLSQNTRPFIFVFGHEPGYPFGNRHLGDSLDQDPVRRTQFFNLLKQYNVIAYFSGHTHVYGRTSLEGVYDVGVGTIDTANNELGRYTYVVVHLEGKRVTFETYAREYAKGESIFKLIDNWSVNVDSLGNLWRSITPGPGGWVTALAIDVNNPNRVLVGGDVLGAAVSHDGGLTWEPSYGFMMNEIEAFFFPKAPYGQNTWHGFSATIGGVYQSYNGGYNWMSKTSGDWPLLSSEIINRPVSSIAKASNSSWVYAACGTMRRHGSIDDSKYGAIYKFNLYTDTQTWQLVADLKKATSNGEANIQHIIAQRKSYSDYDRLFVSLRNNGVWSSDDGGITWIDTNLPAAHAFTMASDTSDEDVLYVAAGEAGIYKTSDAGNSWMHLPVDVDTQTIVICDSSPNVLYAGSYSGPNRGVMKTIDGGVSWEKVFDGYNMPTLPYFQGSAGIKYHALAVDPSNPDHVIVGDDVNLYTSFDGGVNWHPAGGSTSDGGITWSGSNFSGVCGELIAFDPQNSNHFLLGGADGTLWQTWNKGETFNRCVTDVLGGINEDPGEVFTDFQDAAISYQDSNKIYIVADLHGDNYDNMGPLFKSIDGGDTWFKINEGLFESVRVNKNNDEIVLAIGEGVVKRSINGGLDFMNVTEDIGAKRISVDPLDPDVFYATSINGVYKSINGGLNWVNIGGPSVWGRFGKVAVDPNNNILYATSFDGFWKYDGSQWKLAKSVEYASDITVTKGGVVYGAVTSFPTHDKDPVTTGIWRSDDMGETWYLDTEGVRVKRISTLEASPIDETVIAGSDGGGFFMYEYVSEGVPYLTADLNSDGKTDILDLQSCINHILGLQDWGAKADVNGDGSVDVLDVQEVVNVVLEQ